MTAQHFDEARAARYDRKIRLLTPGYEALHSMTNHLLRSLLPAEARLLVVGAGTGMEIITCWRSNPRWRFTAVEPSAEMLARCQNNITAAGLRDRVQLHCGVTETLPEAKPFDAAISVFVSHFIQDEADRRRYFTGIAQRLRAGAPFVVADLHGDTASEPFSVLLAAWRDLYAGAGVGVEEVGAAFGHIQRDLSFVSESRLAQLLRESGFGDAVAFYRAFLFGAWLCRKSP